jgi:hypothetical protein
MIRCPGLLRRPIAGGLPTGPVLLRHCRPVPGLFGHAVAHHLASMGIVPPIVVATDPECWPGFVVRAGQPPVCVFYRRPAAAQAALSPNSLVFDRQGQRLVVVDAELHVSPTDPDGAEELANLLCSWLGYMDAIRGSVAGTPLPELLELCVEHAADCGLYR